MKKRIRKSKSIKSRGAFSAGRAARENVVGAAKAVRSGVTSSVGSAFYAVRDFGRGLLTSQ